MANDLHVWRISLEVSSDSLAGYSTLLSADELARADRYVFGRDRHQFIVARGTLRLLLGRYLHISPSSIHFEFGPYGKPFLGEEFQASKLKFNVSHAYGLGLFAFTISGECGIDVEKIRPEFATREVAKNYFSAQEISELDALSPSLFATGFFECWTRKEAYLKARGAGLQIPLDSFAVTATPGRRPELSSGDSSRWSIYSFQPFQDFVAAVVADRLEWTLTFYDATDFPEL
ncbi:MAG TPA: 4'-phosphopantetheinyl transferase superfamily protein [Candidatus Sulfotelmatobacter sp.]|nr:4'-phosphopantetheinyl transferase superfamily protein [Candidatus Sulfotelmatobacter sp.]